MFQNLSKRRLPIYYNLQHISIPKSKIVQYPKYHTTTFDIDKIKKKCWFVNFETAINMIMGFNGFLAHSRYLGRQILQVKVGYLRLKREFFISRSWKIIALVTSVIHRPFILSSSSRLNLDSHFEMQL